MNIRYVGIVVAVCILIFFGYRAVDQSVASKEYALVESEYYQDTVVTTGNIASREDITIISEENGTVAGVYYDSGAYVEKNDVIVLLRNREIAEEFKSKQSLLEIEKTRLERIISGPDTYERERIQASDTIARQQLESEVALALISANRLASTLEDGVRREDKTLFSYSTDRYYFTGTASSTDKLTINRVRNRLDEVFTQWRSLLRIEVVIADEAIAALEEFEHSLKEVHMLVESVYDIFKYKRFDSEEMSDVFEVISALRARVVDSLVANTKHLNEIRSKKAQYTLTQSQTREELAGGTETDKRAQQARVNSQEAQLAQLRSRLDKTSVRAPFDGVVGEVFVDDGEFITRGNQVVRFVSSGGFDINVNVTEVEIPTIAVGQEMTAYIDALDVYEAVVVRTIDLTEKKVNNVPVYTVVLDVLNPSDDLRPGMTVDVKIPVGNEQAILIIPREAVQRERSSSFVTVLREGESVEVPVSLGSTSRDGYTAVSGDIELGDRVFLIQEDAQ